MFTKIMKLIESKTITLFILVKLQDIFEIGKKNGKKRFLIICFVHQILKFSQFKFSDFF
jgi:hypothetical protein